MSVQLHVGWHHRRVTTTSWAHRRRPLARTVAAGVGLGLLPVVALDLVPELQPTSPVAAAAACGIPHVRVALAAMCAGMAVSGESRVGRSLWAAASGAAIAAALRPRLLSPGRTEVPGSARTLRVMSANVLFGRADIRQVAELARAVDVVAIQENTPRFDDGLQAVLSGDFPYRLGTSRDDAGGTTLWSRTPLTLVANGDTRFTSVLATTTVRGVPWTVATVHPAPPQMGSRLWESDGRKVLELVRDHVDENLVVVGDFNAIEEHLTMRRLAEAGLRNAMSASAGAAGWQTSWPALWAGAPSLIRIDHALHSGVVRAWRPRYTRVRGSDHKALIAMFEAR